MTRVTIHQPNFLPGVSYFSKMLTSDVFVFLDSVPFSKNNWTNRNRILSANGVQWLTVPVLTKGREGQLIADVETNARENWQARHLKSVQQAYSKALHFGGMYEHVASHYRGDVEHLAAFNVGLITKIARVMGYQGELVLASSLGAPGESTELLVAICESVGAKEYVAGPGGRRYLNERLFRDAAIRLSVCEYVPVPYRQMHGTAFVENLSVIDLMFNEGPASGEILARSSRLCEM